MVEIDPVVEEWAERIHWHRRKLRESQETFGRRIGVGRSTVSLWERGEALPQKRHRKALIEQVFTLL